MTALPLPIASATIVRGATTNRVHVRSRRRRRAEPKLYRADPRRFGAEVLCISMDRAQLDALDRIAANRRQARSHVLWDALEALLARPDALDGRRRAAGA